MKNSILLIAFLSSQLISFAQESTVPYYEEMVFERNPTNKEIIETDTTSYGIVLKDKRVVEFYFDEEYDDQLMEYRTFHKKVKLTTERAIQEYNKIYFNLNSAVDLVEAKARVIKPDNSVTELKQKDIKEAENFQEYGRFKYFAFEGIELGADIEYIYTIKKRPSYNGNRYLFQGKEERRNVEFVLIAPTNLEYAIKSLNNFPEVLQDTTDTTRNFYSAMVNQMPAIKSETYSARTASLQGVIYKLSVSNDNPGIVHYGQAGQNVYENMHWQVTSSDLKALKGLTKKLKISKLTTEDKLRKMESYIKSSFNKVNAGGAEYTGISSILANKNFNETGQIKLYVNWLEVLGVDYELCLGSERKNMRFEKDFEVYNCLSDYFIYIPELNKYITPGYWSYRVGLLPSAYYYNYALFMKPVTVGSLTTYNSEVRWIDPTPTEITYTNLDMVIDLGNSFEKTEVSMTKTMAGHEAATFQTGFESLQPEQKKEIEGYLITFFGDEEKIVTKEYENTNAMDVFKQPFIVNAVVDYPNILQKAGPKYLVSVGKIIGPQSELYQENERLLDIELDYKHSYKRSIKIEIPEGYKVSNLKDLNLDKRVVLGENEIMGFVSTYSQKGSIITIDVYEHYSKIFLSKDHYTDFKNVINAAADFNKVVLVFEKN